MAWISRGVPTSENVYNGEMIGLTHCLDTIHNSQRPGSFLFVENNPNITILSSVHSRRLIIDKATRACTGVTMIAPTGAELNFYAIREVIFSQGVFETPKLLMLSGVGSAAELVKHSLDVVLVSRHVGQHLLEHPAVPFVLRVKDNFGMDDVLLRPSPRHDAVISAYRSNKEGPMGSGLLEMVGFPRIDENLNQDLDFVCMFGSAFQWHFPTPKNGSYTSVVVDLVRPVPKGGEVTLNSADPLVQPNINLNFFADDLDTIAMREGVRWAYNLLLNGKGFKDIVIDQYPWNMPLDSDEAMKRAVLDRSQAAFHPCGTARLCKNIDQGVVDPQLRVHSIKNLRAIDASIIPLIPDCRIQNSVYMIGEEGADIIKAQHSDLHKAL
ncbi:hypothetical protein GGI26_002890, partial [Coemansia sp. RSA 1358]